MSEPTEPKPGESANMPTESNAPTPETSQPSAQNEQATEERKESPTESSQARNIEQHSRGEKPQWPAETSQQANASDTLKQDTQPASVPDTSVPAVSSSIPASDTSQSVPGGGIPSFDTSLPSVGSSAAPDLSLPAIDTTLPTLDASLPAIGTDIPTMDGHHSFGDHSSFGHDETNSGSADPANMSQQPASANGSSHYQAPPNEGYEYTQNSTSPQHTDGQQPPQSQPQHQYQSQPPQNYQQQGSDMYHNSSGFSAVNNTNGHGQGQPGQVPQAPIGSPMPPMASMSQYMAGYPSNVSQGMNQNSQMRYQLPGDPNKLLSGGRHKKEVKRRTKTGCLTCRKRRIKVCLGLVFLVDLISTCLRFAGRPRLCPQTPPSFISASA